MKLPTFQGSIYCHFESLITHSVKKIKKQESSKSLLGKTVGGACGREHTERNTQEGEQRGALRDEHTGRGALRDEHTGEHSGRGMQG